MSITAASNSSASDKTVPVRTGKTPKPATGAELYPRWRRGTGPAGRIQAPRQPIDADLARILSEHVHCGEPMRIVTGEEPPLTQPLLVLSAELMAELAAVEPDPASAGVTTYRCMCGFTFDERAH